MQQQASPESHAQIGSLIKREREAAGISIRELGRRTDVSAAQISRIESGHVDRPSSDTLIALAGGLGGDPRPLLFLAGHVRGSEGAQSLEELEERLGDLSDLTGDLSDWLSDEIGDGSDPERAASALFTASRQVGGEFPLWDSDLDDEAISAVREIVQAWPALTPDRRRLVRAFISDQEVLSTLDRLPTTRSRYRFSIELDDMEESDD